MHHLDLMMYTLERKFPAVIELRRYEVGVIDFYSDSSSYLIESQENVKCVALPLSMRREFFKGTSATNEKYIKPFLIWKKRLTFDLSTNYMVYYLGRIHNIKEIITVEDKYYYLDTCSVEGEVNE